jgi:hypothetical protein
MSSQLPILEQDQGAREHSGALFFLRAYYLCTPLFYLLDRATGFDIRVSMLDYTPGLKNAYYAAALACGIASALLPRLTSPIALVESSVNFIVLVTGFFGAYFSFAVSQADRVPLANPFTMHSVINTVISGSVLIIAIRTNPFARSLDRRKR